MNSKPPILWTIAGSDSCSGAGIQADLKTSNALGAYCCTLITSVTAQNSFSFQASESVSADLLASQINALREDLPPQTIKIGMIGNTRAVQIITKALLETDAYVICDPVFSSSSGTSLLTQDTIEEMKQKLFHRVNILTPNLLEAEMITGYPIQSFEDIERAAQDILSLGVKSVVIKGGHSTGNFSQDFFSNGSQKAWFTSARQVGVNARGTGCTFSAALATARAYGFEELDSIVIAKAYINQCLRLAQKLGNGLSMLLHHPWQMQPEDLPWLTLKAEAGINPGLKGEVSLCSMRGPEFPDCGDTPLGFYPIFDRLSWLKRLLPLGIKTAQLRIKDLRGTELETEIRQAILLARDYNCRLFINDYWDLGIKYGAYGVHLGQEDIETADISGLSKNKIRLGVSTHCYSEVARAHSLNPSYLAIGPIFPTTLKSMKFAPQGVSAFRRWKKLLKYPLVAIGGITLHTAIDLRDAGANGIAVVSDVTQHPHPEERVSEWLRFM